MFSFLKTRGLIESAITHKTQYSDLAYDKLSEMRKKEKQKSHPNASVMEEIDTELVLRSFDTILGLGADVSKDQAKALCYRYIQKNPYHDFFNFAFGLHQDVPSLKQEFLLAAARSRRADKSIAAQAALALSKALFEDKKYLESQAWLIYGVMLGNQKAFSTFTTEAVSGSADFEEIGQRLEEKFASYRKGCPSPHPASFSLLTASVLAIIMSEIKLPSPGLAAIQNSIIRREEWSELNYSKGVLADRIERARKASDKPSALMLYKDSSLGLLATESFKANEDLFNAFFEYCHENKIISDNVNNAILTFVEHYPYHHRIRDVDHAKLENTAESSNQYVSSYANIIYPSLVLTAQPQLVFTMQNNQDDQSDYQNSFSNENPTPIYLVQPEIALPQSYPINNTVDANTADYYTIPGVNDFDDLVSVSNTMNDFDFVNQFPVVPRHSLLSNSMFPRIPVYADAKEEKKEEMQYSYGY